MERTSEGVYSATSQGLHNVGEIRERLLTYIERLREMHEAVNHAVVPARRRGDTSGLEADHKVLSFVTQHVKFRSK